MVEIVLIVVINLVMLEGLIVAVFPEGVKTIVEALSPRVIQVAGLVEVAVGLGLLGLLWFG